MARIVMDYEVTIHKTDDDFAIGHVFFVPEVLRENKYKKIVKSDAYEESLDAFEQAIKEKLVSVRKVERAGDDSDSPAALSGGARAKKYSAEKVRQFLNADYGIFTKFLREISNNAGALGQALAIAKEENLANKGNDIDRALARLNALPRTKRAVAIDAANRKRG